MSKYRKSRATKSRRIILKHKAKKDFHSARDCITKGWGFEAHLLAVYIGIIAIPLIIVIASWGGRVNNIVIVGLVTFLAAWPVVLIIMRRGICHHFEKERDEHWMRRVQYGIKLEGEEWPGQHRTLPDNPFLSEEQSK